MYIVIGVLPVFLGLAAYTLVQSNPELAGKLTDSERTVSVLSEHFLPSWHYVIFGGALISAILSVVHSALHASGAQVSHNIVVRVVPGMGGREKLIAARISVVVLTAIAFVLALTSDRIKGLVEIASAFGSAGVFVSAAFGMFTRIGGPLSAGTLHLPRHDRVGYRALRARVADTLPHRGRLLRRGLYCCELLDAWLVESEWSERGDLNSRPPVPQERTQIDFAQLFRADSPLDCRSR